MRCCERLQEREAACEMQARFSIEFQPSSSIVIMTIVQGVQLRDAAAAAEASRELEVSRWKTRAQVCLCPGLRCDVTRDVRSRSCRKSWKRRCTATGSVRSICHAPTTSSFENCSRWCHAAAAVASANIVPQTAAQREAELLQR
jgi:hypothetical protein